MATTLQSNPNNKTKMYKKCCCYARGQCGPYKRHALIDEIIKIEDLHDNFNFKYQGGKILSKYGSVG